jgi:hypothetical protein
LKSTEIEAAPKGKEINNLSRRKKRMKEGRKRRKKGKRKEKGTKTHSPCNLAEWRLRQIIITLDRENYCETDENFRQSDLFSGVAMISPWR